MKQEDEKWHLDRRVPIALIVTIALQTGGIAYFFGALTTRLEQAEKIIDARTPIAERVTRMEVQLNTIHRDIKEIKDSLK